MSGRHNRRVHKEDDVDVTPLLSILVVMIAFLILTAIFSRIAIQEISLSGPSAAGGAAPDKPQVTIEVIVRQDVFEIGNGRNVIATIPKVGMKYDFPKLTEHLLRLKEQYSEKQDVIVLIEPDIEYDYMIQVMDAVKGAKIQQAGQEKARQVVLFPQVSIGDAP